MDITDPSDFKNTRIPLLSSLDSSLRCNICKDFFNAPVITSCSHSFCSLCIRKVLALDSLCPVCRHQEQESKLRKNSSLEDVVESYKKCRSEILRIGKHEEQRPIEKIGIQGVEPVNNENILGGSVLQGHGLESPVLEEPLLQEPDQKPVEQVFDGVHNPQENDQPVSRLRPRIEAPKTSACPICGKYFSIQEIQTSHLNQCLENSEQPSKKKRSYWMNNADGMSNVGPSSRPTTPPTDTDMTKKLPKITYALLKDKDLRAKMILLGIPSQGTRQQVERRHTEWLSLWNSNTDAKEPVSKGKLLEHLHDWEKTTKDTQKDEIKNINSEQWKSVHSDAFVDLVAQARKTKRKHDVLEENTQPDNNQFTEKALQSNTNEHDPPSKISPLSSSQKSLSYDENSSNLIDLSREEPINIA